ncbi:FUSC family protein [Mycobacterium lacus]|uniref:FUSC family protein n=1 Tax=Mycobacterium lacus TaxID=169765 RepID=UPI000A155331|nr:FUSC family protein [Mycobacterium lacus]MCV7124265.1 aromatic acid exporter family protein [Mycobacterium lacus]ORW06929.1 hypothetical protein AWC15_20785 [Mycobacterium lacus]
MNTSLLTRAIDGGHAAVRRLRDVLWAITQASAAAGIAWYIAHDVVGHPDPFFAPIAAAVCVSASNVLHVQRAMQNISGVALGITLGAAVQLLLGTESIAIAVAVFATLCVAVLVGHGFIAQGLTFANQAAGSAILVAAMAGGDRLFERLQEALIGGGLALVFVVLLFPPDPLTMLHDARVGVLGALHNVLAQTADSAGAPATDTSGRPHSAVDRVHERLGELTEARSNARHLVRTAPLRWAARNAVRGADEQAAHLPLLAGSVLHLVHLAPTFASISQPARVAIGDVASALRLAEVDPEAATAHVAAAGRCASALASDDCSTRELVLTSVVRTCVEDLQHMLGLRRD